MVQKQRKARTTLTDVTRQVEVSVSMVSAVLDKRPHCYASKATKEMVIQVARDMGYRPNLLARSLRGQSTRAIGVVAALLRTGRRVPEDVAVIGFDAQYDPQGMLVPLTTIHQPRLIGPVVFDLLFKQMNAETDLPSERINLNPALVVRQSTVAGTGDGPDPAQVEASLDQSFSLTGQDDV